MPLFRSCPFEELVVRATDENNINDDWALIMEIVDKAVNYDEGPKLILQAITKRLYNPVPRVALQAVMLLDSCVKNCGRRFHLEVSSRHFVAETRKILQKMNPAVVDKFKSLIKKWAEVDFKDDPELGLIPSLYYKLKSEGVLFPEEKPEIKPTPPLCTNPDAVSSQEEEEDIVKAIALSLKDTKQQAPTSSSLYTFDATKEPVKPELLKVRAIYDFDAVEDNELTIKAGEIVVIIDKSNDSWWKGSNQRGEGYFPVSFISEDLNAPVEVVKVTENSSELENVEQIVEKPIVIDEEKIQKALQLLNDIDPSDEYPDEKSLLDLEHECQAMSPLIEDKLQEIDKKCTVLNSLNDDIMEAIQMFYKLTRNSMVAAQLGYYYNIASDPVLVNQSTQEAIESHLSNIVPPSQSPQKPIIASNLYIPPNFLPNLTTLTSNQIKQNVVNLPPFVHPQFLPMQYGFDVLPQKLSTNGSHVMTGNPIPNSIYGAIPQTQAVSKSSEENVLSNSVNQDMQHASKKDDLTLLDTEIFANSLEQEPSVLSSQNVPCTSTNANHFVGPSSVNNHSTELPTLQMQNYVTQAGISSNVTTTTTAIEQNLNNVENYTTVAATYYPTNSVLSENMPTSNGKLENIASNQIGPTH